MTLKTKLKVTRNTFIMDESVMDRFIKKNILRIPHPLNEDTYFTSSDSDSVSEDEQIEQGYPHNNIFKNFSTTTAYIFTMRFTDETFLETFRVTKVTYSIIAELLASGSGGTKPGCLGCAKMSPEKGALLLLWYMRSKESLKRVARRFETNDFCAHTIITKGFEVLSDHYSKDYVKWPEQKEYAKIADEFYKVAGIKNALGAIETAHFKIKPPSDAEKYLNLQNYYSIAVQGVVSFDCKFMNVFLSEGSDTPLETLAKSCLTFEDSTGDYFLVGNNPEYSGYNQIITQYRNKQLNHRNKFNASLEIIYEKSLKAFGYLKGRFERLQTTISNAKCIQASIVIHNICMDVEEDCKYFVKHIGVISFEDFIENQEDCPVRFKAFKAFLVQLNKSRNK